MLANKSLLDQGLSAPSEPEKSDDRLVFFGTIGVTAAVTLLLVNTLAIAWLAMKPQPTLVRDLSSGESFRVLPQRDRFERTPAEVTAYVSETLHRLHTWTGTIYSKQYPGLLEKDPGIHIDFAGRSTDSGKIPTATYEASFRLNEAIRQDIIKTIAGLVPREIFENDPNHLAKGTYALLRERKVLPPEPVAKGRWKVQWISDIVLFSPTKPTGEIISRFNKNIYVSAVPGTPRLYPQVPYQFLASVGRQQGLEIDSMTDATPKEVLNVPR